MYDTKLITDVVAEDNCFEYADNKMQWIKMFLQKVSYNLVCCSLVEFTPVVDIDLSRIICFYGQCYCLRCKSGAVNTKLFGVPSVSSELKCKAAFRFDFYCGISGSLCIL